MLNLTTGQGGMGFGWDQARELIRRSVAKAKSVSGAGLASGAGNRPAPSATMAKGSSWRTKPACCATLKWQLSA